MRITRACIRIYGLRIYFQANPDALNMDLTAQELQSAIDNDLVFKHLDSSPTESIYVFRTKGRTLLKQLNNRQMELVARLQGRR